MTNGEKIIELRLTQILAVLVDDKIVNEPTMEALNELDKEIEELRNVPDEVE
jgi:predicted RND superfamily exporter protein